MKAYRIVLFLLLLSTRMAVAQETASEKKALRLGNVFFSAGNYPGTSSTLSLEDFRQLAPGSALLQDDLSHYENSRNSFFDNSFLLRAGAAFSLKQDGQKERRRHEFRLAAVYGYGTLYSNYFWKESRYAGDTFVSVKSGKIYVLDSVRTKSYMMEYTRKYLGLDASFILYSPLSRTFSFYAGMGMNGNFDFNNYVYTAYSVFRRFEQSGSSDAGYLIARGRSYIDYNEEYIPASKTFSASVFLPLGVEINPSKHEKSPGKLRLYYELRPLWRISAVPGLKAHTGFRLQQSAGLRLPLN